MPKVLRIINRFNIGGPTFNAAYLSKYLPSNYETLLIGGEKEDHEESSLHVLHELGLKPLIIPEMRRSINPLNDYFVYRSTASDTEPCFSIVFDKVTDPLLSTIQARGNNRCGISPRQVERAIQVQY